MTWIFELKYKFYLFVKPLFDRVQRSVQVELDRIARLEALAKGEAAWKAYRERNKNRFPDSPGSPRDAQAHYAALRSTRQASCSHLKGGRIQAFFARDYNLSAHIFSDKSQRIKCLTCQREWWKTNQYTDPDWDIAVKMMKSSTNSQSTSEIPQQALNSNQPNGPDNVMPPANIRIDGGL